MHKATLRWLCCVCGRPARSKFCNSFALAATESQSKYRVFYDGNTAGRFNLARAEKTAQRIGGAATAYQLDVTDSTGLNRLASALPPLDILVCNAGIVSHVPAEEMSDAQWNRVIEVNLSGVFRTCRA